MSILKALQGHVSGLEFQKAFIDTLGWNHPEREPFSRTVQGRVLTCKPIAEGGGFEVIEVTEQTTPEGCESITAPKSRGLRTTVDTDVSKVSTSHVLAFVDQARSEAVFVVGWVRDGKRYVQERRYRTGLPIAPLVAFLAEFAIPYKELDPHGELPHTKMLDLLDSGSATAEKVSKKFYNDLAAKRKAFETFLKWIADEDKRAWYVTALLNRLMFIYFVQQKHLVNHDPHFLRNLLITSEASGKDRFYTDYFLPLCFFGFGKPEGERGEYENLFKDVVYLNGGLFALHTVESEAGVSHDAVADGSLPASLYIPDAEFRKWFDFFDSWRWTLDEENAENDGEINPGILGYIFEKYVNQKQMGAYYTKEDITGYICRNTIVPRLFDMLAEAGAKGKLAVDPLPIGPHPNTLNDGHGISDGEGIERYVYAAVKTKDTLPTETPREYAARRTRFDGILQDFEDRKITTVNDFITYNLDIEKMAADFVDRIQDAQVLHDLYFRCLTKITVLDPTCGSGAFLFAALKVLYPLYNRCLRRMEHFNADDGRGPMIDEGPAPTMKGEFGFVNKVDAQPAFLDSDSATFDPKTVTKPILDAFTTELERIAEHPRAYYITKSIIVNNLHGVDIEEEAVEICKLRLFLKLAAYATPDPTKPNQGIEPLPDIDFNILAGNTLVGYTSIGDIDRLWATVEQGSETKTGVMAFEKDHSRLKAQLTEYATMLRWYRDEQLGLPTLRPVTKEMVRAAADQVRPELNEDLWRLYRTAGSYPDNGTQAAFVKSHHPFHWLMEFPGVEAAGGFDVVVGNPPYVDYIKHNSASGKSVRDSYQLVAYQTLPSGNLYAFCIERSIRLLTQTGRFGMIVPIASVSTDGMSTLQDVYRPMRQWHSHYAVRPGKLFVGVDMNLTITLALRETGVQTAYTTGYMRWSSGAESDRPFLFERISYVPCKGYRGHRNPLPKLGTTIEGRILQKMLDHGHRLADFTSSNGVTVYYHSGGRYWRKALPECLSSHYKPVTLPPDLGSIAFAILNSQLHYWYWISNSNCMDVVSREVLEFPVFTFDREKATEFLPLIERLFRSYYAGNVVRQRSGARINVSEINFDVSKSKPIIDEIDRVLAKHYGFTPEELDFIINYDIKYRMGQKGKEE